MTSDPYATVNLQVLDLEKAAARSTVNEWFCDAIWAAPTATGARIRASYCLADGADPAEVVDALMRFHDTKVSQ